MYDFAPMQSEPRNAGTAKYTYRSATEWRSQFSFSAGFILFCFWDLATVELDPGLAHAEIEDPGPHVVLEHPVVQHLTDEVLKVRSDQPKRVLRQLSPLFQRRNESGSINVPC